MAAQKLAFVAAASVVSTLGVVAALPIGVAVGAGWADERGGPGRQLSECPFCAGEYQDSCEACVSAGGVWQEHQAEEGVAPCDASCDDWGGPVCAHTLADCAAAAPPSPPGPCALQIARIEATLAVDPTRSFSRPQCDDEGSFLPVQCSTRTGLCWCSSAEGQQVGKQRAGLLMIEDCLDALAAVGDDAGEIDCEQFPCQNGGACADLDGATPPYECQCLAPFSGVNCEQKGH